MKTVKCPVEDCPGWETTSGNPNILQHIKRKAAGELLSNEVLAKDDPTPHVDFIKENLVNLTKEYVYVKIDGEITTLGLD